MVNERDAEVAHEDVLAAIPLFESLTREDQRALAARAVHLECKEGDVIFRQGDPGAAMFIIESGEVEIAYGEGTGKVVLTSLFAGQYFGELSLFDGAPRSATAVAVKASNLARLDGKDLVDFVNRHPESALRIIADMSNRLRQTNELMSRQVSRNVLEEAEEKMTLGQRVADRVASFGGSWPFIFLFGGTMLIWITINIIGFASYDPYPFILLNLCLSTIAAIQAPIIMMSQNRQATKDKLLAENDYRVNLKAEMEIGALLRGHAEILARLAMIEHAAGRRAADNGESAGVPALLPGEPRRPMAGS